MLDIDENRYVEINKPRKGEGFEITIHANEKDTARIKREIINDLEKTLRMMTEEEK